MFKMLVIYPSGDTDDVLTDSVPRRGDTFSIEGKGSPFRVASVTYRAVSVSAPATHKVAFAAIQLEFE
jgi:hypothetical protein